MEYSERKYPDGASQFSALNDSKPPYQPSDLLGVYSLAIWEHNVFELPISQLREDRMDSDALFEGLRSFGRQELSCPTRVFMFIDLNWWYIAVKQIGYSISQVICVIICIYIYIILIFHSIPISPGWEFLTAARFFVFSAEDGGSSPVLGKVVQCFNHPVDVYGFCYHQYNVRPPR